MQTLSKKNWQQSLAQIKHQLLRGLSVQRLVIFKTNGRKKLNLFSLSRACIIATNNSQNCHLVQAPLLLKYSWINYQNKRKQHQGDIYWS